MKYIHDDCSTDEIVNILKKYENKYQNKINVIYQKENQFSKGKRNPFIYSIFPKINSKYVTFYEGYDRWIDENKLPIQVDLLELNNNLTVYRHKTEHIGVNTNEFICYNLDDKRMRKNIFYTQRWIVCHEHLFFGI